MWIAYMFISCLLLLFAFVYFLRSLFVDILFVYLNRNIKITYIYLATLVYIFVYLLIALFACCLLAWKRTRLTYTLFAALVYMIVYFSLFEWYLSNLFAPAVNPFLLTGLFALLINCLPKPGCSKTPWFLVYCCCLPLFAFYC